MLRLGCREQVCQARAEVVQGGDEGPPPRKDYGPPPRVMEK